MFSSWLKALTLISVRVWEPLHNYIIYHYLEHNTLLLAGRYRRTKRVIRVQQTPSDFSVKSQLVKDYLNVYLNVCIIMCRPISGDIVSRRYIAQAASSTSPRQNLYNISMMFKVTFSKGGGQRRKPHILFRQYA